MPTLHVCPLSRLHETVEAVGASHVVTLINVATPVERPAAIDPERHLFIGVSDIVEARDGHVVPAREHVERLLAFVRDWPREKPLVIHCWAGVSRSTAAAFITACALDPERSEEEIADALRAASPMATPNARLVAVADEMLGREGRMVAAIARIGRGADVAFENEPFELRLG
ncbi:tyrosine phosphatase family protein [Salinarimonas soli]|uniref:Protein tyrosine phosphatase n=1 Tax=Salinarimonas soli TaxID=1638099 RepID=A0A5B2VEW7_9HYPH|nr:tyrosine phosphatase family protein [Salinarimonas soli]KAA2237385.1 protein tyrosine phosphatase [Salinarimonas soli]